ncbi:DNA polymerase III subunit epsilon [Bifidobacterium lemurum]|nr:DNA polymerase III subunit epsilon [Bifidobacterium lemurum]QOL33524.1 DNA polymerase III subunit epsilon [Bifidobacterium lemurum]
MTQTAGGRRNQAVSEWLEQAKEDTDQWELVCPKDADGQPIDWRWVRSLDLAGGIGVGLAAVDNPQQNVHALLKRDYAVRDRVEAILAQTSTAFMTDFDRLVASYRLPRALAYANRRLNDEINLLLDRGVADGLWQVSYERQGRVTVPVLTAPAKVGDAPDTTDAGGAVNGECSDPAGMNLTLDVGESANGEGSVGDGMNSTFVDGGAAKGEDSVGLEEIQDRTARILNARAERRKAQRIQRESGAAGMARANLSGVASPGGASTFSPLSGNASSPLPGKSPSLLLENASSGTDAAAASSRSAPTGGSSPAAKQGDWRDVYLPGRDVDTVMGIDIETTGTDPARVYIIDVGFEFMNMASPRPADAPSGYVYEQPYYDAGDAYGQARLSFGVTPANARHGNGLIRDLTGIDVRERGSGEYRLFDEWPEAQTGLLARLTQQPYVAHNATFEHGFFMLNVAGYAEAYRAGRVTIIDTLPMSRQWDPGSAPDENHPYGDNTLEAYAKRQGALDPAHAERHLGLEDAHIMLVAMKRHLTTLRREGAGPWGASGRSGVGGKACGRRRW